MKIHFLGASGESISGLAYLANLQGHSVTASDKDINKPNAQKLKNIIKITNHEDAYLHDRDLIVYSSALHEDHFMLVKARSLNIKTINRAIYLMEYIISEFEEIICITGCNGKTSTTNIISNILDKHNYDHCAIIGYQSIDYNNNIYISNKTNHEKIPKRVVVEIDESDPYIMNYAFKIKLLIITSFDYDHIENYGSLKSNISNAYKSLIKNAEHVISHCSASGILFDNTSANISCYCSEYRCRSHKNHYNISDISINRNETSWIINSSELGKHKLQTSLRGFHNALNCSSGFIASIILDIRNKHTSNMSYMKGPKRRMEEIYNKDGICIIDDYCVHDEAVEALLISINKIFYDKNIIAIFEPHRYARLESIHENVRKIFTRFSDMTFISEMFHASVEPQNNQLEIYNNFVKMFNKYSEQDILNAINKYKDVVIVFMGAGYSSIMAHNIVKLLNKK